MNFFFFETIIWLHRVIYPTPIFALFVSHEFFYLFKIILDAGAHIGQAKSGRIFKSMVSKFHAYKRKLRTFWFISSFFCQIAALLRVIFGKTNSSLKTSLALVSSLLLFGDITYWYQFSGTDGTAGRVQSVSVSEAVEFGTFKSRATSCCVV